MHPILMAKEMFSCLFLIRLFIILFIRYCLQPNRFAFFSAGYCYLNKSRVSTGSVPMRNIWRTLYYITFPKYFFKLSFFLVITLSLGYQQNLPGRMRMPFASSSGFKRYIAHGGGVKTIRCYQRLQVSGSGEICIRNFFTLRKNI